MADAEELQELEDKKPRRACDGLREELVNCLLKTDCITKQKLSAKECLDPETPGYSEDCRAVYLGLFECKRSMLDTRQRFRGRKGY